MKKAEEKCYLCGTMGRHLRIHKGVRGNADVDVYKCRNCGLVFLGDFINNTDEFYRDSEMRKDEEDRDSIHKIRINAKSDDIRRFRYTESQIANRKILDFGCGAGGYLLYAKDVAEKVYGIELEKKMADTLNNEGIKCFSSIDIAEEQLEEKVDVITMWHVLEHLGDPISMLKRLSRLLTSEGRLFIEVPNADDALFTIYESEAFADFSYWECHLFLFNNFTLKQVIEKSDMDICFQTQIQRYPLSNHLYWLTKGKPGGHVKWCMLTDSELDKRYGDMLAGLGRADTIIAECKKRRDI